MIPSPIVALFRPIVATTDLPPVGTSRESGTFDFKERQDPADQRELAKDVAAFANALGGVLLVGAVEDRKRATLGVYKPMADLKDAETLRKAYELAVTQRCVPQPVIEAVRIETTSGVHPPGHVVAVNVYAASMGPIGVRWDGMESFAFPLRTATQTHWMTPTELAMLMVPQIRRIAILLDSIPLDQRENVQFIFQTPYQYENDVLSGTLVGIDQTLTTVTMKIPIGILGPESVRIAIPIDRVNSVWRRGEASWSVDVGGYLNRQHGNYHFSTVPS